MARTVCPTSRGIRNNESLPVAADGFLNLIHVDDVVQIIRRADQQLEPPELLCVADGQPVQRRDFYACLADLLGCQPPRVYSAAIRFYPGGTSARVEKDSK